MQFFSFYLMIWGVRGYTVDRLAAILVLTSFAIGMTALALLMLKRIDPIQYGALALASFVVIIALVLRWRSQSSAKVRT